MAGVMKMHMCAVRLCGLVYFFAFLGNVVDGPVMWLLTPPAPPWTAEELVSYNKWALIPSIFVILRPRWWLALAICWPLWHQTVKAGGAWFYFGWDQMMDEIGFLSVLLSISLSLYDEELQHEGELRPFAESDRNEGVEEELTHLKSDTSSQPVPEKSQQPEGTLRARGSTSSGIESERVVSKTETAKNTTNSVSKSASGHDNDSFRRCWRAFWGVGPRAKGHAPLVVDRCCSIVAIARDVSEVAMTLAAFRLFLAAGLIKMRVGSRCWKDHTCLYDHFETQPMPNPVAWYFHNYTPHWLLRVIQWFAIDMAELRLPLLLLGFLLTMGPVGILHKTVGETFWPVRFPGRFVGSALIMAFVCGMFFTGNYAFLHPLSVVALVASMALRRDPPMEIRDPESEAAFEPVRVYIQCRSVYRKIMPWLLIWVQFIIFLPSLRAYGWLIDGNENLFSSAPIVGELLSNSLVSVAENLNQGIPYNHHAYFAGAVHHRNEMVLFAELADGSNVELDIPCKVGRVNRLPCVTSPLHRRFAWQWWFLALGTDPTFLHVFLERLCEKEPVAWNAVESSSVHNRLQDVTKVYAQMYNYHFSTKESDAWWTRAWTGQQISKTCR